MRLGYTTWSMVTVRAEEAIPLLASIGYDPMRAAIQSYRVLSAACEAAGVARARSAVR
jgi:hypothetical protein